MKNPNVPLGPKKTNFPFVVSSEVNSGQSSPSPVLQILDFIHRKHWDLTRTKNHRCFFPDFAFISTHMTIRFLSELIYKVLQTLFHFIVDLLSFQERTLLIYVVICKLSTCAPNSCFANPWHCPALWINFFPLCVEQYYFLQKQRGNGH